MRKTTVLIATSAVAVVIAVLVSRIWPSSYWESMAITTAIALVTVTILDARGRRIRESNAVNKPRQESTTDLFKVKTEVSRRPSYDFLEDLRASSLLTIEQREPVKDSWIVEVKSFGESALLLIGGMDDAEWFEEGKATLISAGIVGSAGRYLLNFEVCTGRQLRTYVESYFINDLESSGRRRLDIGARSVSYSQLMDLLPTVLQSYRSKLEGSNFTIGLRNFLVCREGDLGQIIDAENNHALFLQDFDNNDPVVSLTGALDGYCLELST